jgi:hypothetical protein
MLSSFIIHNSSLFFIALNDKGRGKEGSWEALKPGSWEKKGSGEAGRKGITHRLKNLKISIIIRIS